MKNVLFQRLLQWKRGEAHAKAKAVILLFSLLIIGWLIVYISIETKKQERQNAALRASMSTLQFARIEIEDRSYYAALSDLQSIPVGSPDYEAAQFNIADVQDRIDKGKPPNTSAAEDACSVAMKLSEEFPSTIKVGLFSGTRSNADLGTRTIAVAIDYTAKNSTGAELPYRFTCTTDYKGVVLSSDRTGR